MSEKTELPSPKRLRDARRQGNVAHSRTLASAIAVTCTVAALLAAVPSVAGRLHAYARVALAEAARGDVPLPLALERAGLTMATLAFPLLLIAFLGALAGSGLQVGMLFNGGAVGFKLERLSPSQGFERMFSKKNLAEVLKSALVTAAVLWLTWSALRGGARVITALPSLEARPALGAALELLKSLSFKALGVALLIGGADYLLERSTHLRSLMMSREDLKREHKESEGDPQHKAKRRQAHKALLNGTVARGVHKATAVVVNPTHVAVALRYDPAEAAAPTIVAKGVEDEAAKIRFLARRLKVPIVKDIPLARALVRCDLGEEIPEELYQAAAVVLRKVYEMGSLPEAALPAEARSVR